MSETSVLKATLKLPPPLHFPTQALRRPDLDYSELFSDDVGKLPGLSMWQIENFYPVELDEGIGYYFYF